MAVLKPATVTDTSYLPLGTEGMVKSPEVVVVASKILPVSTFLTTTFAPATAAEDGSITEPVMVPRSLCANAATDNSMQQIVIDRKRVHFDAVSPIDSTKTFLIRPPSTRKWMQRFYCQTIVMKST